MAPQATGSQEAGSWVKLAEVLAELRKFEALHRHFQRGSPQTKAWQCCEVVGVFCRVEFCICSTQAILVLAAVKILNANHDALKGEVVGFLKEIQAGEDTPDTPDAAPRVSEGNCPG